MSKNLNDLFNVDEIKKAKDALTKINLQDKEDEEDDDNEEGEDNLPALKKSANLEIQLQNFNEDDTDIKDLDKYAAAAFDSYEQLMDTGNNFADTRSAGKFYEAAVQMMGNAISAKNAKISAKLKKMELLLKVEKLTQAKGPDEETEKGSIVATRSEILKVIKDNNKS